MKLSGEFELKVDMGDVTIGLRCSDKGFSDMLQTWCGTFRSDQEPDFWLEVELRTGRTVAEIRQIIPYVSQQVNGSRFRSCPPLWEGEISWDEARVKFRSERELFHNSMQPRFLNVLLSSIYNTICEYRREGRRHAFLFHGCGVVAAGKGYLFTGPSGSGKTTVARLAGSRVVLHDEAVLIRDNEGEFFFRGTPLLGGTRRRANGWHRLRAVLMLAHNENVGVRLLSKNEAYRRFTAQVFDTAPLIPPWVDRKGLSFLEQRVDLSASAVRTIPMYELQFRQDDSFWPIVEDL